MSSKENNKNVIICCICCVLIIIIVFLSFLTVTILSRVKNTERCKIESFNSKECYLDVETPAWEMILAYNIILNENKYIGYIPCKVFKITNECPSINLCEDNIIIDNEYWCYNTYLNNKWKISKQKYNIDGDIYLYGIVTSILGLLLIGIFVCCVAVLCFTKKEDIVKESDIMHTKDTYCEIGKGNEHTNNAKGFLQQTENDNLIL